LKSWLPGVEKERKRTIETKTAKKQARKRGGREQKRRIGKETDKKGRKGEKNREKRARARTRAVDNAAHKRDNNE